MCSIGSGEFASFTIETTPKARKNHTCCECGSIIVPGQVYEKIVGLWDEFATYKTCSFCASVRKKALSELDLNLDEGIIFGELWECVGMDYYSGEKS